MLSKDDSCHQMFDGRRDLYIFCEKYSFFSSKSVHTIFSNNVNTGISRNEEQIMTQYKIIQMKTHPDIRHRQMTNI